MWRARSLVRMAWRVTGAEVFTSTSSRPSCSSARAASIRVVGLWLPEKASTRDRGRIIGGPFSTETRDAFGGADDVGYAHAELVVDHHGLAARDEAVVHQDVQRLAGDLVQLDDRAGRQAQQVLDRHARSPELHRQVQGHV